jgi:hypothetical protein
MDFRESIENPRESIENARKEWLEILRTNLSVENRRYHFKSYERCFVGSEAVRYMIESGMVSSEQEAILIGNCLLQNGDISHVTRDHDFKNGYFFYRFHDDEPNHGCIQKDDDGRVVSLWRNFAALYLGADLNDTTRMSLIPDFPSSDTSLSGAYRELIEDIPLVDRWNVQLLDNVHPSSWIEPEGSEDYNLLVIGAGAAGLVSAVGANGVGARVAVVESHLMGGDCLNFGCVPSKALLESSRVANTIRRFVTLPPPPFFKLLSAGHLSTAFSYKTHPLLISLE